MTDFIWPSDRARAENDELSRVCEHLEEVLDEHYFTAAYAENWREAAAYSPARTNDQQFTS